jgi:hypothetical protein
VGLNPYAIEFLMAARAGGVDFGQTVTIGRQELLAHPRALRRALARHGLQLSDADARELLSAGYAEELLARLGAERVDSLDASPYEGATVVHDLNTPIPPELERRYSVVLDSGTLEHVFDFPTAVGSCMRMAREGGHVLVLCPADGLMGHGFYQFSPELLFRVFSAESGFEVERMLLRGGRARSPWYAVSDPAHVGERVTRRASGPAYLYVQARRVRAVDPVARPPQQSDYATAWANERAVATPPAAIPAKRAGLVRRAVPASVKERLVELGLRAREWSAPGHDPRFFRPVDITQLDADAQRAGSRSPSSQR